jgi:hypothetical protein
MTDRQTFAHGQSLSSKSATRNFDWYSEPNTKAPKGPTKSTRWRRWISGTLLIAVAGASSCGTDPFSPANSHNEGSQVTGAQFVVSASLMGLATIVLKEVSKASISWAWEDILTKSFGEKRTGDTARKEASDVLRVFKGQIDEKKLEEIQIKMNSLQNTLVHEYVRGMPESATQLALLSDKVNDLLATFNFWLDSPDYSQKSFALAHLAPYAYLSGVKVFLLNERYLASQNDKNLSQETLARLKRMAPDAARQAASYLERATGPVAEDVIRTQKIARHFQEFFEKEDFDIRQGIQYQYCAEANVEESARELLKEHKVCGPKTSLKCNNELDESCLAKAKDEAQRLFEGQNMEQNLIREVKNILWTKEIDQVIKTLKEIGT